jgi:hypothetical protein
MTTKKKKEKGREKKEKKGKITLYMKTILSQNLTIGTMNEL